MNKIVARKTANRKKIIAYFFCRLLIFFKINIFEKFLQEYLQGVKQFGSISGLTRSRA